MEYRGDEYLYSAISGLGHNIGEAIIEYKKRHDEAAQMESTVNYLRDNINPVTHQPYISKKDWESIAPLVGHKRELAEQGLLQGLQFASGIDQAAAGLREKQAQAAHLNRIASTSPMAGQYVYNPATGQVIGQYDEKGNIHYFPKQAMGTEEEQQQAQLAEHPSQDPSLVIQKPSPAWHHSVNKIIQSVFPGGMTGPFAEDPEIRKAAPSQPRGAVGQPPVQVGQPQPPGGVGQPQFNINTDPRAKRIRDEYRAGRFGSVGSQEAQAKAQEAIQALGY